MDAASHLIAEMLAVVKHSDAEAFALSMYAPAPVPGHGPLPLVRLAELLGLLEQTVDSRPDSVRHSRPIHTPVSLPVETQQLILASLTWPILMRCRLVCRYWADACVKWVARIPDGQRLTRIIDSHHSVQHSAALQEQCALLARFEKLTELHIEVSHANVTTALPLLRGCFRHLRHVSLDFMVPVCNRNCRDREKEWAVLEFLHNVYQTSGGQCTSLTLGDLNEASLTTCGVCTTPSIYDSDGNPGEIPIVARIPLVFVENVTKLELHDWSFRRLSSAGLDRLDNFSALTELRLVGLGLTSDINPSTNFPNLSPRLMACLRILIVDTCRADVTALITFVAMHCELLETLILSQLDGYLHHLPRAAQLLQTLNTGDGLIKGCSNLVTLIFNGDKGSRATAYCDAIMILAHLARATLETLIVHGDVVPLLDTPMWDFRAMPMLRHVSIEYPHLAVVETIREPNADGQGFDALVMCQTGIWMLDTLPRHGLERVELSLYFMHAASLASSQRPIWSHLANVISNLICRRPAVRHLVVGIRISTRDDWVHCFDKLCTDLRRRISTHLAWHPDMLLRRLTLPVFYEHLGNVLFKCVPLIFDNPYNNHSE